MDSRIENSIWYLNLGENDDDYMLTILPRKYPTKIEGNNLDGYRDYLSYWEDNPCKPIILHTDNAIYYKNNIYNDNVIVLTTAFDILQYHKIIDSGVHEEYGDKSNWDDILKSIKDHSSLIDYLKSYFSMSAFNSNELILKWNKHDEYGKWLIWLWLKVEECPPYLKYCVSKCKQWTELLSAIINSLLDYMPSLMNYWEIYSERKELLKKLEIIQLPNAYWEAMDKCSRSDRVYYYTDLTIREKEEIIRNYCEIQNIKDGNLILENIYPDATGSSGAIPNCQRPD